MTMSRPIAVHDFIERVSMMSPPELRSLSASLPRERMEAIEDIAWVLQLGDEHTEALITHQINIAAELETFAAWKQGSN